MKKQHTEYMTAPNYQSTSQQSSVSLDNVSMHGNNNNYAILVLIILIRGWQFILDVDPSHAKRTHTLYPGGYLVPPYYLINTRLYKSQVLQGSRDTLQGLRKYKVCTKSSVWLPWKLFDNLVLFANNCQNDYEKQVIFECSQTPQIKRF